MADGITVDIMVAITGIMHITREVISAVILRELIMDPEEVVLPVVLLKGKEEHRDLIIPGMLY